MKKLTAKKMLTYLFIVFNSLITALVYTLFVFPNKFAPAGVGGLCTIIQELTGISVGSMSLLINIPLAAAVYILVSKTEAVRGLVYTVFFSLFLGLLGKLDLSAFAYSTENSAILGPLVGGIIMGYSCASLLKVRGHQAGSHFVSRLVLKYHPEFNFSWVTFALNAVVAVASYFVFDFKLEPVLLCILYCFSSSLVMDAVTKSSRSAVRFEIVTDQPEAISQAIISELHHSATLLPGKGIYQGKPTNVLVCVVNRSQTAALSSVLRRYPGTFAVMSQVNEVVGNFKRLDSHGKVEKRLLDDGMASESSTQI